MKFSEILSGLRRETGRSQRQAASELGVSQALLSHYENGAREPRLEFVIKACGYYGVTADYMLGRSERREAGDITALPGTEPVCGAVSDIFRVLRETRDQELFEAAIKYLAFPVDTITLLFRDPDAPYSAKRDANQKLTEVELVAHVRRVFKERDK